MISIRPTAGLLHAYPRGQAAIIGAILAFVVSSSVVASVGDSVIRRLRITNDVPTSLQSYYAAESGIEEALLRMINSDYTPASSYHVTVNGATAAVSIDQTGNTVVLRSAAAKKGLSRNVAVALTSNSVGASFSYGIQVGDGGLHMQDNSIVYGNVYSNGSVIGLNKATVTGDVIVASGTTSTINSQYTFANSDHSLATAGSNRAAAQSFTPTATGAISKVAMYISKVGTPTDNLKIRILTDSGGSPTKTVLVQASIPASTVGITASWIEIGLPDPPVLTAGTRYWLDLDVGTSSSANYWKWRKDSGDSYPNQSAKYTSGCCSGTPTWTALNADLDFKVWIGGSPTKIDGMIIGSASAGSGRANIFVDSTIHGTPCPNEYCITDSPTPSQMPISEGVIQDWRDQASAGGVCAPPICDASGNLLLDGKNTKASIGPLKINGNLTIRNEGALTLTGTIWVVGNIDLNNKCSVSLDASYGSGSGVLLTDGWVDVANQCDFYGSGVAGSYPLVLSTYAGVNEAIDINNGSNGVIFYASAGEIAISNNAAANSLVGYKVTVKNGATITYDGGLLDLNFTAGPTGGWAINSWSEVP